MAVRLPRIALLVLEALPNARAVRQFVADHAEHIALVGLSNAERPSTGGLVGQVRQHVGRSGPAILPYLAVNFGLPDLLAPLAPLTQRLTATGDAPTATPLARLCERLGVPVLSIDDVNSDDIATAFDARNVEIIVTFHFDQILTERTLALAPLGGLNVHPSLLPRHRGPVPTIHALAEGEGAFGVTVHKLAATIDAGAILAQQAVDLPETITATRASVILHEHGRTLLDEVLTGIGRDGVVPEGRMVPRLPYCGFPDRALLSAMKRRKQKLTDRTDLFDALTLSMGRGR